jgi:predicted nucleic acid-binding protein
LPQVFLDTMMLIWAVRKTASNPAQQEMLNRARWLISLLEEKEATPCTSTVNLAEYLRGCSHTKRGAEREALEGVVHILDFNAHAAEIAAGLLDGIAQPITAQHGRQIVKADAQVVATAWAHGIDVFYTFDSGCEAMARRAGLTIGAIPNHSDDLGESQGQPRISSHGQLKGTKSTRKPNRRKT